MRYQWSALPVLLALVLPGKAAVSTWIVEDNGGPGVDFTQIQTAIDAAAPGDTLLVMPGNYTGFSLRKGMRILGQPPASSCSPASSTSMTCPPDPRPSSPI